MCQRAICTMAAQGSNKPSRGGWRADCLTHVFIPIWFFLCCLLVYKKRDLHVVFFSFVASFIVSSLASIFPQRQCSFSNAIVAVIHSLVVITLIAHEDGSLSDWILAISTGYYLFDVWDKMDKGLFVDAVPAMDLMHHTIQSIWFITALYRGVEVPILHTFMCQASVSTLCTALIEAFAKDEPLSLRPSATSIKVILFFTFRVRPYLSLAMWATRGQHEKDHLACVFVLLNCAILCGGVVQQLIGLRRVWKVGKKDSHVEGGMEGGRSYEKSCGDSAVPAHLWCVHGHLYDLNPFLKRHPGGSLALSLGRGRDCTALFESYHPFTDRHRKVLANFSVDPRPRATLSPGAAIRTPPISTYDPFYATLCARVSAVLTEHGLMSTSSSNTQTCSGTAGLKATPQRVAYYISLVTGLAISYVSFVRGLWWGAAPLFGLMSWLVGGIGHDGGHFSVSSRTWVNVLAAGAISPIASPVLWLHQHTFAHHSHTNDFDKDPDLHHFRWLRPHHLQTWIPSHHYQSRRLYVFALYCLIVFGEALWVPLGALHSGHLYGVLDIAGGGFLAVAAQVAHFLLFGWLCIWRPLMGGAGIISVLLFLSTSGLLFGCFSQVNHLNEVSIAAAAPKDDSIRSTATPDNSNASSTRSWAVEQVETSNNFCTESLFWTLLSNSLNYQIEHHLFPGINPEHLWRIAPTVRSTCEEFNVCYRTFDSFSEIMSATLAHYTSLSTQTVSADLMENVNRQ